MLPFILLWVVPSTDSYPLIKDKYPTFYDRSYCLSRRLQSADTNE